MSFMFDTQHFVDSLKLSCPSLKVNLPPPESLIKDKIPGTGLREPEKWRAQFYDWLEQYETPNARPMVVSLGRSYLQYPIYSDGSGFALSFGGILKLRSDVRILASKTLVNLIAQFHIEADLAQAIIPNAFFGVHLRTEKDSQDGWPVGDWIYSRYDTQAKFYLDQAPRSNVSVIYVASGDLSEVSKFSSDAAKINMTVATKHDLLVGDDLRELEALKWDQQALVDFLVMMKASDFAGVGHSCFAWNVPLKRHVYSNEKGYLDGPQMLSDKLSQVYGAVRGYPEYAACLWP